MQFNATGAHLNSYIMTDMFPTYRSCATESGTGMKERMFDRMERKLNRRDIFAFIYSQISNETTRVFGETADSITDLIIEMCADIERQVQIIRGPESEASRIDLASLKRITGAIRVAKEEWQSLKSQAAAARREAVNWNWVD